nr:immunoglobulin heavy chain junction region [Macaca mulatta]
CARGDYRNFDFW